MDGTRASILDTWPTRTARASGLIRVWKRGALRTRGTATPLRSGPSGPRRDPARSASRRRSCSSIRPRTGSWPSGSTMCCRRLSPDLRQRVTAETHGSAIELATEPHGTVDQAMSQVRSLRRALARELEPLGLRPASAGTHPSAVWSEIRISAGKRHQEVYGSMRELARREPTFALHVHVGVGDPDAAIASLQPPARTSGAAAGDLGQLTVLAGSGHRTRIGSDPDLPSVSAGRYPACLRRLSAVRRDGRPVDPVWSVPGADVPVVGHPAAAEVRDRSRCESWTCRPGCGRPARWSPSCSRSPTWSWRRAISQPS